MKPSFGTSGQLDMVQAPEFFRLIDRPIREVGVKSIFHGYQSTLNLF